MVPLRWVDICLHWTQPMATQEKASAVDILRTQSVLTLGHGNSAKEVDIHLLHVVVHRCVRQTAIEADSFSTHWWIFCQQTLA